VTGAAGTTSSDAAAGSTGVGTAGVTGTAGAGTAGTMGAAGGMGTAGMAAAPACAPVTQVNQAAVSLTPTDISAYKFAATPAPNITKMDYDPVNKVVVLETADGHFYKFDPAAALPAGAGTATTATATETSYVPKGNHYGLAYGPDGAMYVLSAVGSPGANGATMNSLLIRKGVAATAGGARTWTTVATSAGYPFPIKGSNFSHSYSGLTVSPDGQYLFVSSGARTDHGEVEETARELPLTSAIFRVPTNGSNIMLPADDAGLAQYMYSDGTRNSYDMAFNANGDLIAGDNGPDIDLPDEVNWIQQGKHYGFPWRFGGEDNPVRDPAFTKVGDLRLHTGYQAFDIGSYDTYDATFPPPPANVTFVDPIPNNGPAADFFRKGPTGPIQEASKVGAPMPGITGHRSPLGLAFDVKGVLCGNYYKQGFLLSYGSLPQSGFADQGQDMLLMKLTKGDSGYTMSLTTIATGLHSPMDSILVGNRLFVVGLTTMTPIYAFVLPTPAP
jgi:glucose/arabinose dehydrogenase